MPELNIDLPDVPDVQLQDAQYTFDGMWMPDLDAALIGPENFQTLQNLRYKDKGLEGVSAYVYINNDTAVDAATTTLLNGYHHRTVHTQNSYVLVHTRDTSNNGKVYENRTAIGSEGDFVATQLHSDTSTSLLGRFSSAPQGNMCYCNSEETRIYAGDEQKIASAFMCDDASFTNPRDVSDKLNNAQTDSDNLVTISQAGTPVLLFMTTRPIEGFTVTVNSANVTADTMVVKYWNGTTFAAVSSLTDNTESPAGTTLGQSGTVTFDSTDGSATPYHFEELFLYAYSIEIDAVGVTADLSQITVDMPWQTPKDVWDGVYRQPIQFQVWDNSDGNFDDYSLHVNQSSDVNTPVGAELNGLTTSDFFYVMFEEQQAGIRFIMLADKVNKANAQFAAAGGVQYWDGSAWQNLTFTDGTLDSAADTSMNQSGLISWEPPSDEEKQTEFGSVGYMYKFIPDATFTAASIIVDICLGVPAQQIVKPFDFSVLYKNRLMLGGFSEGDEGNRMDFSATNAPDVWNGSDSSNHGSQSLFFGNDEAITCATQLYNRFGSNIFAMLLVFKASETYLLTGDTPSDFQIFPVSLNSGCPAPLTLATAEVGFEAGEGLQRQVAVWCSHAGPMMFDGAVVKPIRGIDVYFDPQENEFVNWSAMDRARGWVDHTRKEYNLLLPSGSGQTTCNVWLVYDLIRKKWFTKDTGTADFPQSGWNVVHTTGEHAMYGGLATGKMVEFEEGTSWAARYTDLDGGSAIEQKIRTGDFFPSNNIWDEVLIRKFKLISEKLSASITVNVAVNYYENAANDAANVLFQDSDASSGINVDFQDMDVDEDGESETLWASAAEAVLELNLDVGTDRLVRLIQDLNQLGWSHSFEFIVSTTDVKKGWKPIAWGIRYRVERKDDTAT